MNSNHSPITPAQMVVGMVSSSVILWCAKEMTPAWATFQLAWPPAIFYMVGGLSGALWGGFLAKYYWPGILGGALGGVGALVAVTSGFPVPHPFSRDGIILALIGSLPGLGLNFVLQEIVDARRRDTDPSKQQEPEWMGDAAGRKRRLRIILAVFLGLVVVAVLLRMR
jgi:hypothetical protein